MTAKSKGSKANQDSGQYVRKSTLVVAVVAALVFGLYMGTLFTSFGSFSTPNDGSIGDQAPQANAELEKAKEAVKLDPQNSRAWVVLGNLYFDLQNATESVKAYTKALEIQPNNPDVLTDRGTMYRELGQFELALQSYSKASSLNPNHKNALFNSGIVLYYDLNRKAEAIQKWEQLLRLDPNAKAPNGQTLKDMINELR